MSAFGYGSTYYPSWRAQIEGQANPQTNPQYNVSPEVAMPNFTPSVTQAWADPNTRVTGTWHQGSKDWDGATNNKDGEYRMTDAWKNPVESISNVMMGKQNTINSLSKQNSLGGQGLVMGENMNPIYSFATGNNRSSGDERIKDGGGGNVPGQFVAGYEYDFNRELMGDKNAPGGAKSYGRTATNSKELFDSIDGLSMQQLQGLTGNNLGWMRETFGMAGQEYANAYANKNYGKHQTFQQDKNYGANSLTQAESSDWLQKAYGKLMKRMNDNYLL